MTKNTNKKTRENKQKYVCIFCDFTSSTKSEWDRHTLTSKHKILTIPNKKQEKNKQKYVCIFCDFTSSTKSEWDRHIITTKHKTREKQEKTRKNKK